jgi:two-component system sensor histidine kinase PilS (NtrC family)
MPSTGIPSAPARLADVIPPELKSPPALRSYRRLLSYLATLRVLMLLVLIGATLLFTRGSEFAYLKTIRNVLLVTGALGLVPSTLYFPLLQYSKTMFHLRLLAVAMVVQDSLFSAIVVVVTGGTQSAFTFFFSLTIVISSIVLARWGSVLAVSLSLVLLGLCGLYEARVLTYPSLILDLLPFSPLAVMGRGLGVNALGFVAIGILASFLGEQLRRTEEQRERFKVTLDDLRQLHETILACVAGGIVSCTLDRRVLHMNRAAEGLLRVSDEEAKGRPIEEIFPEVAEHLEKGKTVFEVQKTVGGQRIRHLMVTVSPLISRDGKVAGQILAIEDISLLKEMEEKMKAEARLATLGKLAAVLAHEIRNPVAAISASAQMLKMSQNLDDDERKTLDIVIGQAWRLNQWVSELLDYARPKRGELCKMDLKAVVEEVIMLLKNERNLDGYEIKTHIQPGVVFQGDEAQIQRMLLNLARNALEAMPRGGVLTFEGRLVERDGAKEVVIAVKDTGQGIPQTDMDKIFEPFFTTKPNGTGLGLAIVARAVEEHNGRIEVKSIEGAGTDFYIYLPVVQGGDVRMEWGYKTSW